MPKQQLNLRVSALTLDQIEALVRLWGVSKTELITVLIDRTYQAEKSKQEWASTFSETQKEISK